MKKLMIALAFLGLGTTAFAQEGAKTQERKHKTPEERTEMRVRKIQENITSITPEQAARLREVFLKNENTRAEKRQEMQANREAMHAEMKKMRAETEKELNAILTPEQMQQLQDYREKKKEMHKQKKSQHHKKG